MGTAAWTSSLGCFSKAIEFKEEGIPWDPGLVSTFLDNSLHSGFIDSVSVADLERTSVGFAALMRYPFPGILQSS